MLRYDFRIGGRVVGTFTAEDTGSELRQQVSFTTESGVRFENAYEVRYVGQHAVAYRIAGREWADCPDGHLPTAAYPLLVRHEITAYLAIDESTGRVAQRTLERHGDEVIERSGDAVTRRFTMRGDEVVAIDWGGATSTLLS
jgi:hypothetical protein